MAEHFHTSAKTIVSLEAQLHVRIFDPISENNIEICISALILYLLLFLQQIHFQGKTATEVARASRYNSE